MRPRDWRREVRKTVYLLEDRKHGTHVWYCEVCDAIGVFPFIWYAVRGQERHYALVCLRCYEIAHGVR